MDEDVKARLTRRSIWMRAVYMLIFLVAYSVAEVVLGIVVIIQFLMVLFTGTANVNLLRLGNNLSTYIAEVLRFMSFNTEAQGFPFGDWPDEAIDEDNVWLQEPDESAPAEQEPTVAAAVPATTVDAGASLAADSTAEDESSQQPAGEPPEQDADPAKP